MTDAAPLRKTEVIAPNLKRRLSGVTATVVRLIPFQRRLIAIATTGPGLPTDLPHIPLVRMFVLPRNRLRVWHARRNTEMVLGLMLRHLFRRRLALLFTSAAQRHHKGFTRWLIARMDRVIATSPQAAGYLKVPATVVMHGVDCTAFRPADDRGALRARLGLPVDACLIGCFGRIRAQKGVDLMIDAALALMPARPGLHMIFTGRVTDDQRDFFNAQQARIGAAGLGARIHFLGELGWDQLPDHYSALDLFCAPARWEGFGLTPLEAMASGVPAVCARVGAFEALIRDGETGSLVPPGDAAALTDAIRGWIDAPALLAAAGRAARAHVEKNHRIEDEARQIVAVYREMLGSS